MSFKQKEIDDGYQNISRFWPSNDFSEVRENIEKSNVFKILRLMPKGGDLHTHIGSTVSLDYIYENLTSMSNFYVCLDNDIVLFRFFNTPNDSCNWILTKDLWENNPEKIAYIKEFLTLPKLSTPGYTIDLMLAKSNQMSAALNPIYLYRPAYEKIIYRILEEFYEDNVMYWEVRSFSDRLYELNGTVHDPIVAVKIMKSVIDKFVATHPGFIGAKYIYGVNRQLNRQEFGLQVEIFRQIKKAFPDFVVGFDIMNYEERSNTHLYYIDQLLELSKETSFYFHAGETFWYGSPIEQNLVDAILLNAKRISHPLALTKHPKLVNLIKKKDMAIELAPVSYQVMGTVLDSRQNPASHFFAQNLSVIVVSDNPGSWHGGLSYDFYETFVGMMSKKADLRALKQLVINSLEYSGMTKVEKEMAFRVWNKSWMKFVKHLAYEYKPCQTN